MMRVNIHQAKTQFSRLVALAADGEEIIIAKAGQPVARLVPYQRKASCAGREPCAVKFASRKNFDEPLPKELVASFAGKS